MVVTRFVFTYKLDEARYVLLNSLSGAVDIVGEEVTRAFDAIRRGKPHSLSDETVAELSDRGYLYPSRAEEDTVIQRLVEFTQRRRILEQQICFVLCPTMTCNLRCPYCFEPHTMHEKGGLMTDEQVEKAFFALDRIREMRADFRDASINIFGGEPLLPNTRRAVTDMLARAAERDMPVAITTNGTYAHLFLSILAPHKERIMIDVTMDGIKEIHDKRRVLPTGKGSFDRISDNISLLLAEGLRVSVRMNLNEANIHVVTSFLEYVKRQGWHEYPHFHVSLSPVTDYTGRGGPGLMAAHQVEARVKHDVPDALTKTVSLVMNGDFSRLNLPVSEALGESSMTGRFLPSLYYCEASGSQFYCMGPDGLVYPCNQIIGDPEWAIGSFAPEFKIDPEKAELWHGRNVTNMPQCMECSIAFLCSGGCPVMAKRSTGSPMDSYCGTSKKELVEYLDSVAPRLIQLSDRPT